MLNFLRVSQLYADALTWLKKHLPGSPKNSLVMTLNKAENIINVSFELYTPNTVNTFIHALCTLLLQISGVWHSHLSLVYALSETSWLSTSVAVDIYGG